MIMGAEDSSGKLITLIVSVFRLSCENVLFRDLATDARAELICSGKDEHEDARRVRTSTKNL